MPELDTLRGLAVLGVMCLHAFFWQYASYSFGRSGRMVLNITRPGWVGVNLFFVLSGFLITGILLDSRTRPDYYRRFYTRRGLAHSARLLSPAALFACAQKFVTRIYRPELHLSVERHKFLWCQLRLRSTLVACGRGALLHPLARCGS